MNTYISFLRGINVGGHSKIKMKELIELYESLGLKNVKTYVQSGNVVFESNGNNINQIIKKIETGIQKQFGLDVKVMVRTPDEIKRIIKNNPFLITYVSFFSYFPILLSEIICEYIFKRPLKFFKNLSLL